MKKGFTRRRTNKKFATGKNAITFSDRDGFKYKYSEMVKEPGTNLWVHRSESDGMWNRKDHPQNFAADTRDTMGLENVRRDGEFTYSDSTIDPTFVPGLYTWFDFSDRGTLAVNPANLLSVVQDKSRNGFVAVQTNTNNMPSYSGATINGRPVVSLSGGKFLNLTSQSVNQFGASNLTVFAVGTATNNPDQNRWISGRVGTNTRFELSIVPNTATMRSILSNSGTVISSTVAFDTNAHIYTMTRDSLSVKQWFDGVFGSSGSGSDVTLSDVALFGRADGAGGFSLKGTCGEIIVYNRVLTASEMNIIGQYLAFRWGVTWNTIT